MSKGQSQLKFTKVTPILIVGFGSIGQRHYRNLKQLGYKNVAIHDIDCIKLKKMDVQIVSEMTDSVLGEFPIVFICNPSHLHTATALRAAKAGCHIFVEKPLALNPKELTALHRVLEEKNLELMVACNYRFHPAFDFLKKIVRSGKLGRPLTVNVVIGYDLRTARMGVDYQKTYAISRKTGGGVLIDSGSHVVDYLVALFGSTRTVRATCKNLLLPMEAEDFAQIELEFDHGVFSTITLDYFSFPRRNFLEIQCDYGMIRWDVVQNTLISTDHKGKSRVKKYYEGMSEGEARNDMFIREVKYYMDLLNKKQSPVSSILHAEDVSRVLSALLQSEKSGKAIQVSPHKLVN